MSKLLKAHQGSTSFVVALVALFGVLLISQKDTVYAAHVPQDYDTSWTRTNLYDIEFLSFQFTNLTINTEYVFTLQALDIETGLPSINLDTVIVGPHAFTSDFAVFNYFEGSWPIGSHFPVQLVDNFGQIVSKHFITPFYHDNWIASGTVLVDDKQAIGGSVYHPVNGFGYQHEPSLDTTPVQGFALNPTYTTEGGFSLKQDYPLLSIVNHVGDYVMLHYQTEDPLVSGTDKIQIRNIADNTLLAEFVLGELECYSQYDPLAFWSTNTITYLPLTTDGIQPLWINEGFLNGCFTSASTDPSTLIVPPGAYSYGRVTTLDVLIDEGESVWIVTDDPANLEWSVDVRVDPVRDGREQRLDRRQHTENIHDGFPVQNISDDGVGLIDATNYDYAPFRTGVYTPNFLNPTTVTWDLQATDLRFGQITTEFPLQVFTSFAMIIAAAPASRTELFQRALKGFNLDNDTGSLLLLLVFTLLGFMLAFSLGAPAFMYPMVYLVVAGFLIFLGIFSTEIQLLVGLSAFATVALIFITPFLMSDRE